MPKSFDPKLLVTERNAQYKDAWRKTGFIAQPVSGEIDKLLVENPDLWYNWIIILNKLVRILGDPSSIDSWKDIAGYAQLVVDYLWAIEPTPVQAETLEQRVHRQLEEFKHDLPGK